MLQRSLRFLPLLLWISVAAHAAEITLGRVVDQHDRPVVGATVEADSQEAGRRSTTVETGADGRFAMADFSRGSRIRLWASKQGYGNGWFEGVEAPTQELVTIKLTPTHRVLYTVRNEKGEPIPGATVTYLTKAMKLMMMSSTVFVGNDTLADEGGRCEHGFAEPAPPPKGLTGCSAFLPPAGGAWCMIRMLGIFLLAA